MKISRPWMGREDRAASMERASESFVFGVRPCHGLMKRSWISRALRRCLVLSYLCTYMYVPRGPERFTVTVFPLSRRIPGKKIYQTPVMVYRSANACSCRWL